MIQYFPYGTFERLSQEEIKNFDVNSGENIDENSSDWYPHELHYLHNDYPLAPENLEISNDMLKYCSETAKKYRMKVGDVKKLVPNLGNKSKYVVYYRNLSYIYHLE